MKVAIAVKRSHRHYSKNEQDISGRKYVCLACESSDWHQILNPLPPRLCGRLGIDACQECFGLLVCIRLAWFWGSAVVVQEKRFVCERRQ
jgi:hypothetical protein